MSRVAQSFRAQGVKALPKAEREHWIAQYFSVLASGFAAHAAHAPPETSSVPKRAGRKKQEASKNLLDALLKRAEQVLGFLEDLSVPFTNNLAERDLRMSYPFSKRFLGPFAVQKEPPPFASSAAISPPCANKVARCLGLWRQSLLGLPSLSHGGPE
jgi:transposase IS66 family protein